MQLQKNTRRQTLWVVVNDAAVEVERGLTSHQTHYRSYRGRVFTGQWPNQQCL